MMVHGPPVRRTSGADTHLHEQGRGRPVHGQLSEAQMQALIDAEIRRVYAEILDREIHSKPRWVGGTLSVHRSTRRVCRAFGVRPRDIGYGVETPARSAMHAAYRAKTRRRRA